MKNKVRINIRPRPVLGLTYEPSQSLLGALNDLQTAETAYEGVLRQEKELEALKKQIVERVKEEMEKSGTDSWGKFSIQQRTSLSWNLEDVRSIFGKNWSEYVKPDAALLKIKMVSEPKLAKCAVEKKTEAIVFKA